MVAPQDGAARHGRHALPASQTHQAEGGGCDAARSLHQAPDPAAGAMTPSISLPKPPVPPLPLIFCRHAHAVILSLFLTCTRRWREGRRGACGSSSSRTTRTGAARSRPTNCTSCCARVELGHLCMPAIYFGGEQHYKTRHILTTLDSIKQGNAFRRARDCTAQGGGGGGKGGCRGMRRRRDSLAERSSRSAE